MEKQIKQLGVVVSVNGEFTEAAMYDMTNDSELIWNGNIITGPKLGAFLTVHQNDIKIITTIDTEKVIDQQNTLKSDEFDNRYSKNSINRLVTLKVKGIIQENEFNVTSKYVPMIGNEITYTTVEELAVIYGIDKDEKTIILGESLLEEQEIQLPINKFYAAHIGIFGNTGSGKSNTLHKLYLELFKTTYKENILKMSQFFLIDFNGEYTGDNMFSLSKHDKEIFHINTRVGNSSDKLPVKKEYLLDPDILSLLFDARPATQVPFLRNAIKDYKEKIHDGNTFSKIEMGLLRRLITDQKLVGEIGIESWLEAAEEMGIDKNYLTNFKNVFSRNYFDNQILEITIDGKKEKLFENSQFTLLGEEHLKISELETELKEKFENASEIRRLYYFLQFQKIYVTSWKSTNIEHINPLFHRIKGAISSLEKVIELKENINTEYKSFNIVSLVNANQEIKRLIPMLLSKMIYDEHKSSVAGKPVKNTKHLIIDEAHNILNAQYTNIQDDWQDYRLSIFEEIIKEGRKFGFFLSLASQRPADISPTILSQIHNYIIHRLVNDLDLKMLENTMPTLDRKSFNFIPSLGKGEVIITGSAIQLPVIVKIPREEKNRPSSDDIKLTDIWG